MSISGACFSYSGDSCTGVVSQRSLRTIFRRQDISDRVNLSDSGLDIAAAYSNSTSETGMSPEPQAVASVCPEVKSRVYLPLLCSHQGRTWRWRCILSEPFSCFLLANPQPYCIYLSIVASRQLSSRGRRLAYIIFNEWMYVYRFLFLVPCFFFFIFFFFFLLFSPFLYNLLLYPALHVSCLLRLLHIDHGTSAC
ncbi:hypothetical protein VTN02DRAFT_3932 [Thermoascus thermophilus]